MLKMGAIFLFVLFFNHELVFAKGRICSELLEAVYVSPNQSLTSADRSFRAWRITKFNSLSKMTVADFFPENFLDSLSQERIKLKLETEPDSERNDAIKFLISTEDGIDVIRFRLWPGKEKKHAVIENLRVQNPLRNKLSRNVKNGQFTKGLPMPTMIYFRERLFEFLRAGGFEAIDIESSQNLLVRLLYQRIVGGRPITAEGQKMTDFLNEITHLAIHDHILDEKHLSVNSIDQLARSLGSYGDSHLPKYMVKMWAKYKENPEALLDKDFSLIYHPRNDQLIGITYRGIHAFIVPFLPGEPLFTWYEMHEKYPQYMLMVKPLGDFHEAPSVPKN